MYAEKVINKFAENSIPENIEPMSKYMKHKFDFFGIKTPQRKNITKEIFSEYGYPEEIDFISTCKKLWIEDHRELQYFTLDLINKNLKYISFDCIKFLEYLIVTKSWWDTVDGLASNVLGYYFKEFPEQINLKTKEWINSNNIWLQRSAILFQLKYKSKTDFNLLKNLIEITKHSNEFFIKKAIGWSLREYSKTNPKQVISFVNKVDISDFSKKEALKWLKNKGELC